MQQLELEQQLEQHFRNRKLELGCRCHKLERVNRNHCHNRCRIRRNPCRSNRRTDEGEQRYEHAGHADGRSDLGCSKLEQRHIRKKEWRRNRMMEQQCQCHKLGQLSHNRNRQRWPLQEQHCRNHKLEQQQERHIHKLEQQGRRNRKKEQLEQHIRSQQEQHNRYRNQCHSPCCNHDSTSRSLGVAMSAS